MFFFLCTFITYKNFYIWGMENIFIFIVGACIIVTFFALMLFLGMIVINIIDKEKITRFRQGEFVACVFAGFSFTVVLFIVIMLSYMVGEIILTNYLT